MWVKYMNERTTAGTVIPYHGPWTLLDHEDNEVQVFQTQAEAIQHAKQVGTDSIVEIDAGICKIRLLWNQG